MPPAGCRHGNQAGRLGEEGNATLCNIEATMYNLLTGHSIRLVFNKDKGWSNSLDGKHEVTSNVASEVRRLLSM
eukprot:5705339-Amphidinium_carterae.1